MSRVFGSKINLADENNEEIFVFLDTIADLLCLEQMSELKNYTQHLNTTRYQHSLNVAYYTFRFCRKFNLKTYEATRAALLHDFYFYNYKEETNRGYHPKSHAQEAYKNACAVTYVTPIMKDAIIKHMWPLVTTLPKNKESWVVQGADKYAACIEFCMQGKKCLRQTKLVASVSSIISANYN